MFFTVWHVYCHRKDGSADGRMTKSIDVFKIDSTRETLVR